ncbi:MAG: hypothetical protein QM676_03880 [Novosphingobium sp.]
MRNARAISDKISKAQQLYSHAISYADSQHWTPEPFCAAHENGPTGGPDTHKTLRQILPSARPPMKHKSKRWFVLGALLLLVGPGLPTALAGGIGGLVSYPRYLPGILHVKYAMFMDARSETICKHQPERCMDRVSTAEFHRAFVGNAFALVRPQAETLRFYNRSRVSFSPPMADLTYYYIDGYLCTSRGTGIFPSLYCEAIVSRSSKYYSCKGTVGKEAQCTELRRLSDLEAL